jgi:hypothetical protein
MKRDFLINSFPKWLPYIATLYYVDLLFLLPRAVFILGKPIAAGAIIVFTALWTMHTIALYYRKEINRKIHLVITDIDFALRLPFVINFVFFRENSALWHETVFFVLNIITLIAAVFSIYLLTDNGVKKLFK